MKLIIIIIIIIIIYPYYYIYKEFLDHDWFSLLIFVM